MDAETCNRSKSPFYNIPQENGERNYPYVNSIENINFYDHNLTYTPEDPQQALTWKGPYKPLNGYWDEERGEWVKGEYIYPTYFFNFGTF